MGYRRTCSRAGSSQFKNLNSQKQLSAHPQRGCSRICSGRNGAVVLTLQKLITAPIRQAPHKIEHRNIYQAVQKKEKKWGKRTSHKYIHKKGSVILGCYDFSATSPSTGASSSAAVDLVALVPLVLLFPGGAASAYHFPLSGIARSSAAAGFLAPLRRYSPPKRRHLGQLPLNSDAKSSAAVFCSRFVTSCPPPRLLGCIYDVDGIHEIITPLRSILKFRVRVFTRSLLGFPRSPVTFGDSHGPWDSRGPSFRAAGKLARD